MGNAEKLVRMAEIVEREWSAGGTGANLSAHGIPGGPCAEDAAAMVGYPIRELRRAGLDHRHNDAQRSGAAVGAALRRETDRQGVVTQKPERVSRQHPGAAPTTSGSRLITAGELAALLACAFVLALVVHFVALLLLVGEVIALAIAVAASAWLGYRATSAIDWPHIETWWERNRARATARAALAAEIAETKRAIALGPVTPITADEALLAAWTTRDEKEIA